MAVAAAVFANEPLFSLSSFEYFKRLFEYFILRPFFIKDTTIPLDAEQPWLLLFSFFFNMEMRESRFGCALDMQ